MKRIRRFLGLCNHKWEKTGGKFEYYQPFFNRYVEYEQYHCEKCNKYKH